MATVVCLAEWPEGPSSLLSGPLIHREMETAGFTKVATNISLATRMNTGFVEKGFAEGEDWQGYRLTRSGLDWLIENQSLVALRRDRIAQFGRGDEDIPF
jgi:hypothetical protein